MKVEVIFFGQMAEITGTSRLSIENVAHTNALINQLAEFYPLIKDTSYRIAVNKQLINGNAVLENNMTVAFLPPFSGG